MTDSLIPPGAPGRRRPRPSPGQPPGDPAAVAPSWDEVVAKLDQILTAQENTATLVAFVAAKLEHVTDLAARITRVWDSLRRLFRG